MLRMVWCSVGQPFFSQSLKSTFIPNQENLVICHDSVEKMVARHPFRMKFVVTEADFI